MPFDHNDHYHRLLLRHVPYGCRTALDVGCGTGRFARRLAQRGIEVDAVDRSAQVIEAAVSAAPDDEAGNRPRFRLADVTSAQLPQGRYDFVSCLASVHHMPFRPAVEALRGALAPGGTLVVLGCYPERSPVDYAWSGAAIPVNAVARAAVAVRERCAGGRSVLPRLSPGVPPRVRAPVARPEVPLKQIRQQAAELLPGSTVRRLLFWRYLLVYRR
ncbi:class I SAM-dependent methyltransferase [Streptomyces marispadix]|uniref:Class I SAM-dependent methyltransferase n=1 Tax=Streptomyces marispadix TaxID=2922868 RepID=A0ABS9ST41_9ACTN|nr:class I SAM-dependent methyltransferase [Streptomyces marispadix]MCH6159437.1 class I SAM-dependent methyltransferase [Streptomyces marispadix]